MAALAKGNQVELAIVGGISVDVMDGQNNMCSRKPMRSMVGGTTKFTAISSPFSNQP
jgi:hypothetical protein